MPDPYTPLKMEHEVHAAIKIHLIRVQNPANGILYLALLRVAFMSNSDPLNRQ